MAYLPNISISLKGSLTRCHVWVCPRYIMDNKLHKSVLNVTKWAP